MYKGVIDQQAGEFRFRLFKENEDLYAHDKLLEIYKTSEEELLDTLNEINTAMNKAVYTLDKG